MIETHVGLLEACKKQDHTAQLALYKLHYKTVYNTCLRILNHSAEAEDAMQDSFIKVFEKIDGFRDNMVFSAWLKRIAVNTALDRLKARKAKWVELNDKMEVIDEPEDYEMQAQTIEQIKYCMTQLPETYRVVLSLLLFEGYDQKETTEILNLNPATLRTQYARAKSKLIEKLKECKTTQP